MRPKIMVSRLIPIAVVALLLAITGCKSKNLPTFQTPSVPSASPPSSSPSIPKPPSSSPSSSPSKPSPPSSSGESGSSAPSPPSLPSPGLPDISGKESGSSGSDVAKGPKGKKGPQGKKGTKSGDQASKSGEPGQPNSSESGSEAGDQRAAQTQAGDDLQKAGEDIAKAGSGDFDPLIPKTESDTDREDGDIFADGSEGRSDSDEIVDFSEAGAQGEGSEQETSGGAGLPADLQAEIQKAQEAIAKAGGALQEAGAAVAGAESDEELAAAEDLLSEARIAVILATQDIELLEEEMGELPGQAGEDPFEETSEALQKANIALVIATRSILIAKSGSADLNTPRDDTAGGGILVEGDAGVAVLEDELDESLIIFDGQIGDAREAVLTTTPPPETGSGSGNGQRPKGGGEVIMGLPEEASEDQPTEQTIASAQMPDLNQGDIPDAQGDDIVAQQLREAAMSEADPELQAKLWEEYKRYKEGL